MTKELKDVVDKFVAGDVEWDPSTKIDPKMVVIYHDTEKAVADLEEQIEALRKVISDALRAATTGRHVDRAIRASMILEDGLAGVEDE